MNRARRLLSALVGGCCLVVSAGLGGVPAGAAGAVPAGSVATASGGGAGLLACTAPSTQRVSVASMGAQSNGDSDIGLGGSSAISADGRYVAFRSDASDLVPGDTNGVSDVFVHDRLTGTTERVSVSSTGVQGDDGSGFPAISADGRFVAFESFADNLVPGDTNDTGDVFVRDRMTGSTERVSVSSTAGQANDWSFEPAISADGRFVAFTSLATNLVPGGTNGYGDVFVRDRVTGTTELVSVSSTGAQGDGQSGGPAISADGRYVAFWSEADNLVPGDASILSDVLVRDRVTGTTELVSVSSTGAQGDGQSYGPVISVDGRYVAFWSTSANLVPGGTNTAGNVFVRDRVTGTTELVSVASTGAQGNDTSVWPSISADGQYVAFTSAATNLVPGDTNHSWDVFVRDRVAGTTERVSLASTGTQGNDPSNQPDYPAISADGRYVAFSSAARNLVPGDTNDAKDVFVRDRGVQTGVCGSAATATLNWHNGHTGSNSGYGFAAVATAGSQVCFGLVWSNNLPTPTGADLDPTSTPGTPAVTLFTGTPGPHTGRRSAWGCVTTTAATAADVAQHPDRYLVTVRTAKFPAGAIAGRLQP